MSYFAIHLAVNKSMTNEYPRETLELITRTPHCDFPDDFIFIIAYQEYNAKVAEQSTTNPLLPGHTKTRCAITLLCMSYDFLVAMLSCFLGLQASYLPSGSNPFLVSEMNGQNSADMQVSCCSAGTWLHGICKEALVDKGTVHLIPGWVKAKKCR